MSSSESVPIEASLVDLAVTDTVATTSNNSNISNSAGASSDCATCVLSNTASTYDFHIIICDRNRPEDWPGRIQDELFVRTLDAAVGEYQASGKPGADKTSKLTCCGYSPEGMPGYDVETMVSFILYPVGRVFAFVPSPEIMPKVVDVIFSSSFRLTSEPSEGILSWPVPWQTLFLICAHTARDKRCGRAGPLVMNALESAIEEACQGPLQTAAGSVSLSPGQVRVLASSHIGGHKFAGTGIVYPSGDWFGHMSKANAKDVLGNVILGTFMPKCFRGRGLASLEF